MFSSRLQFILITALLLLHPLRIWADIFSPERPDAPDNALTIRKGNLYLESEVVSHSVKSKKTDNTFVQSTLRYGMTDHLEFLFNTASLADKAIDRLNVGDISPRLRVNHYGLEGTWFQLSTIYGFNLPMNESSETDWGSYVGVPFAFVLPQNWYIAGTVAHVGMKDRTEDEIDYTIAPSLAVFRTFNDNFDLFAQTFGTAALTKDAENSSYFGGGAAWRPYVDLQLDFYVNYGSEDDIPSSQYAVGFAKRFL